MAKDKRIGELPGISASAVVGLNRVGIVTMNDLLVAEFDRVAYIVDDYNEAARLVREAKKLADAGRRGASRHADPNVPSPLSQTPQPAARGHMRVHQQQQQQPPQQQHTPPPPTPSKSDPSLSQAMAAIAAGLSLSGDSAAQGRATLARRLSAAAMLIDDGGSERELMACALLESAEGGNMGPDDISARYGPGIGDLIEECTALRAVPMLPSGKPPRYYLDMARSASREARRVCAAHLLATLEDGPTSLPGGVWYAALLIEGLESAGPDDLVAAARAALDGAKREAA